MGDAAFWLGSEHRSVCWLPSVQGKKMYSRLSLNLFKTYSLKTHSFMDDSQRWNSWENDALFAQREREGSPEPFFLHILIDIKHRQQLMPPHRSYSFILQRIILSCDWIAKNTHAIHSSSSHTPHITITVSTGYVMQYPTTRRCNDQGYP